MLTTLRITGFAVVDQVEVRFGPGLNVLTGETGAGKSLLVGALHLVLGGRMSADVLREGADEASVEALFELPTDHPALARLEAAGVPARDASGDGLAELLVRRVVSRAGRGRVFVNGTLCTVAILEGALRGVVDVTGQHEHVSLLDAGTHLDLLDAFAGASAAGGLRARYRDAFEALSALVREERALADDEGERARRADYLAFQLDELDSIDPTPGEDARLEQERKVLAGAARLAEAARGAEALAYGEEGSAAERIGQALRVLHEASGLDPRLEETLSLLRSAAAEVEEAGRSLSRYAGAMGGDPDRLAEVDDRIAALRGLARKHGGSLDAALARREAMKAELAGLTGAEGRRGEVARALAERAGEAAGLAAGLGRERRRAAQAFCRAVTEELEGLAMSRCRVEVASPVYDEITAVLYDPKFIFHTPSHQDRTRTFCTNPGGRVRVEEHQGFRLVNGDALKSAKTANTNFAILNTVTMTEPLQDTTEMGEQVARFANFWGGGNSLVVQRLGDLLAGRRSKPQTFFSTDLGFDKLVPTLPPGPGVTPGDISFAYPGRIVRNLQESVELLARVIPGVAHPSTTIYVPEIKFYDVRYPTSNDLETNVAGLFVAGDGAGKSRGIVGAAVNGLLAAEGILRRARAD